ncbi:iron-sulfur cluster assembly accessory protein [bacterium]|nr:iron-sulfur cluster assembly accessory protein [bacterium]
MIQLSETAAEKIKVLISEQSLADIGGLRVYASSGCCSNRSFGMALEAEPHPEDNVFLSQGVRVLVDPSSYSQLEGANIGYKHNETSEGFTIEKAQGHSQCKCGGNCNC